MIRRHTLLIAFHHLALHVAGQALVKSKSCFIVLSLHPVVFVSLMMPKTTKKGLKGKTNNCTVPLGQRPTTRSRLHSISTPGISAAGPTSGSSVTAPVPVLLV